MTTKSESIEPRRGRPPLSTREPSTEVSVRIPVSLYQRVYRRATLERASISEIVRHALATSPDFRIEK